MRTPDGECKFWLDNVRLARNRGVRLLDLRAIERLVFEHRARWPRVASGQACDRWQTVAQSPVAGPVPDGVQPPPGSPLVHCAYAWSSAAQVSAVTVQTSPLTTQPMYARYWAVHPSPEASASASVQS